MLKRPEMRCLMVALSCLSVLILLLSACGAPNTGGNNSSPTTSNAVKGGTWIDDLFEEPNSLIPNGSSETFADMVDQSIYLPLFYGDANGTLHAGAAKEVPTSTNGDISSDLKTWTFHLKPGLVWSDGQPYNADDVNFSQKLWNNSKFGAFSTIGLNLITSTEVSADKLTIIFHLKQPYSPFVSIWADGLMAPLPAHEFSSMPADQVLKSTDNLNPKVVSGPFMMSESKPGDHYTVVRNPKYYRASEGLPYLDSVVFRVVSDQNTILKDLQAGTVDSSWFLDVTKTIAYQRLNNYKLSDNPKATNFEGMFFNFKNPILGKNLEVRQAMAMAVDHQSLIDTARRGQASPLCTDHSAGLHPGYQPDAPCTNFDIAAANKLLDNNGWTLGSDGVRAKNGQRLEFQYSTTANNLWRADDELINQQNFKKIGIKINIQNYPASTFFGSFLNDGIPGKYDIAEYEQTFGYDADDSSLLQCDQIPPNGANYDFYCNHNLDNLFKQEQATADPATRQAVFNKIHQIYLTDFPFVTLYSPVDLYMVKNGTHNYNPAPGGATETINIWEWWCDDGKCPHS